jgi:ABC-type branched-subunit amino acid transport system ATPase component
MTTSALSLDKIHKFFGQTEIIRDVTLHVAAGERHAVIGPNGAGKTTLFNLISGRFAPSSGVIALNGTRIDNLPPHRINRLGLSRSFSNHFDFPPLDRLRKHPVQPFVEPGLQVFVLARSRAAKAAQ